MMANSEQDSDRLLNWRDGTAADVSTKRKALVADIKRYSYRYTNGKVENILVVGKSGAGKSGFINTVAKVVNGEYFQIAPMGSGIAQSKTLEILRYKNFGARTDFPLLEEHDDDSVREIRDRLPNVTDFAGLGDVDEPHITEKFDLLLQGCIPPGTTYGSLERDSEKYGSLRVKYDTPNPEWKITKIVFIQSCTDDIPTRLIRCLLRAMTATDEVSDAIKYTGEIFLLITKYDRVESLNSSEQEPAAGGRTISLNAFVDVEKELANQFNIGGNLEYNRLRWVNYCSETGFNNPNIDVIALEFLKHMLMPTVPRDFDRPKTSLWTTVKLEAKLFYESLNLTKRDKIMIVLILVLCIFVAMLLSRGA